MSAHRIRPAGDEESGLPTVVLMAPYRQDAQVLARAFRDAGLETLVADDRAALDDALQDAGCLLVTQEALTAEVLALLDDTLAAQPNWSELPVLVLAAHSTDGLALRERLAQRWTRAKLLFYARPLAPVELLSGVQLALVTRLRQFRLRDQIAQEIELRRELNHRVKNILTSVQAMAQMTRRSSSADDDLFELFLARLRSLAAVHSTLQETNNGGVAFTAVAREVLRPYVEEGAARVVIESDASGLRAEAAKALALCLHELATNALKYGALSGPSGRVLLRFGRGPDAGTATFSWVEQGGPPASAPTRRGYGLRYLKTALRGLFRRDPVLEYPPEGFRLEVEGPADDVFES